MTNQSLAQSYYWKATKRLKVLAVLLEEVAQQLEDLAAISSWLRKEREFSFYGDVDFIPTEEYSKADAQRAIADAEKVLSAAAVLMSPEQPKGTRKNADSMDQDGSDPL